MQRKRTFIPVEELFQEWNKDPKYVAAYDSLKEEFASASSEAVRGANMTQEEVATAKRVG